MLDRLEALLLQTSRSPAIDEGRLEDAYRLCLETVCAGLEVNRAGIWLHLPDRSGIRCAHLIDSVREVGDGDIVLTRDVYPCYFGALDEERAIVADDACEHPSTREFRDGYLIPLGITSMLDVPIRHRGAMVGIVCCEHDGPQRRWRREEAAFAASIADLIGRAITANAQVQTEIELRKLNTTLEDRIAERTQALADALVAAEAANRAKSRFLATMSHELRTPLTAILGYADLMLEDLPLDVPLASAIGDIAAVRGSAGHLLALIDDILDLARIEAGALTIAPESFAPAELVHGVVAVVRPQAAAKGDTVVVEIEEGLAEISADRRRVAQILVNLVGNAVKFTRDGTITIRARSAPGERIAFEVEDSGEGIDPEHLERIFERFYQADSSPTREHGGTGLGLSISRALAEAMGGALTATSERGRGSVFRLELPR